jgi:hypothetical protein
MHDAVKAVILWPKLEFHYAVRLETTEKWV